MNNNVSLGTPQVKLQTVFLLLVALYLLLASHNVLPSPSGFGLDLPAMNIGWLSFCLLIAVACFSVYINQYITLNELSVAALLLVVLLYVPLLYSPSYPVDFYIGRMLGVAGLAALFISFQQMALANKSRLLIVGLVVACALIEAVVGIVQIVQLLLAGEWKARPNVGTLYQSNNMATLMVSGWIFYCYLLFGVPAHKNSRFLKALQKLSYVVIPVFIVNIIFTGSRVGYLSLLLCALLLVLQLFVTHDRARVTPLIKVLLVSVVAVVVSWGALQGYQKEERRAGGALFSANQRVELYKNSIDLIQQKPFLGHGYGSFRRVFLDNYARLVSEDKLPVTVAVELNTSHPHNELLLWFIEGGVVPVIAIIGFALLVLYRLFRSRSDEKLLLLSLLLPVILIAMTDIPLYSSALHLFMLVFGLYLIDSSINSEGQSKRIKLNKSLGAYQLAGVLLLVIAPLFFITNLQTIQKISKFLVSTPTTTRYLMEIDNPIAWKNRIDFYYYAALVDHGNKNGSPEDCLPYIQWANDFIPKYPFIRYYEFLVFAYQCTGDKEMELATLEEMIYLYPEKSVFSQLYDSYRTKHASSPVPKFSPE